MDKFMSYEDRLANGMMTGPDSLDAAWADAEAALPDGWVLLGVNAAIPGIPGFDSPAYHASAREHWDLRKQRGMALTAVAGGNTPTEALRALAEKLRVAA